MEVETSSNVVSCLLVGFLYGRIGSTEGVSFRIVGSRLFGVFFLLYSDALIGCVFTDIN